jgi:hypothetical protein
VTSMTVPTDTLTVPTLTAARSIAAVRGRRRPETPAELATMLDPNFVVTPTIRLLSDIAVRSVQEPDQRDIVTTPPRTGKSRLLAIWTVVWALANNPDLQIVLVSYSDELAQAHSREARALINEHSAALGIRLSPDKTAVGRWRVDGHAGGLLATGINSGVTGFGADLLILDDVVKDAAEADSAAHRKRVVNEYRSTLATRVHPSGSVLLVMTRWHPEDLAGELLASEPDVWTHTNIPAVAETGVSDALNRMPGAAMTSALGFTPDHYAAARRTSGERAWYALYMGSPTTPQGGLIKAAWLDTWRMAAAPPRPLRTIVAVDPSDSGKGDRCGIIAASQADGVVALIADRSEPLTSEQWARRAVELAVEVGASQIAVETYTAGETYTRILKDTLRRMRPNYSITVTPWRGKGDALARSAAIRQAFEVGTCRIAGHLPEFESAVVSWQTGQHQPDSLAAAVIAFDRLSRARSGVQFGVPSDPVALKSYLRRKIGS